MKLLKPTISLVITLIMTASYGQQEGEITINQDSRIKDLLELKKEINAENSKNNRYKIQIFSGSRVKAEETQKEFKRHFNKWKTELAYETPNYKIWAGSFLNQLEADKALLNIKRKFPSAFIFKPKKELKRK